MICFGFSCSVTIYPSNIPSEKIEYEKFVEGSIELIQKRNERYLNKLILWRGDYIWQIKKYKSEIAQ